PLRNGPQCGWSRIHGVTEDGLAAGSALHRVGSTAVAAVLLLQIMLLGTGSAVAAPGDLIADVIVNEEYPDNISPSVAFDGTYLYHTGDGGSVLHRINVPPAGATQPAAGQVDTPIQRAPSGIVTLSYDAGRDSFWAVGGDGLAIYLLRKTGVATLAVKVDPNTDRPGSEPVGDYPNDIKLAYDAGGNTISYSSEAGLPIYDD